MENLPLAFAAPKHRPRLAPRWQSDRAPDKGACWLLIAYAERCPELNSWYGLQSAEGSQILTVWPAPPPPSQQNLRTAPGPVTDGQRALQRPAKVSSLFYSRKSLNRRTASLFAHPCWRTCGTLVRGPRDCVPFRCVSVSVRDQARSRPARTRARRSSPTIGMLPACMRACPSMWRRPEGKPLTT